MTIDEAIKHCEEVAEQQEADSFIDRWSDDDEWSESLKENCRQCAADHRQLAEWLKELKNLREIYKDFIKKPSIYKGGLKMADNPIYDNLQAPKETINAINDTNTLSATQSTSVYQCPKCGRLMKSDLAMCGVCLFYQINAQINGHITFY